MMRWTIGAAAGLVLTIASPSHAQDSVLEREGLQLVRQVEEVGRDVQYHTERLTRLASNPSISRWTHYHHLDEIKRLVNTGLRPALVRLTVIQGQLPAWKQKSVEAMLSAAQTLAADTTSAFMTKAENPKLDPAMNADYRHLVEQMHQHADAVVDTSERAAEFAEWHIRAVESGIPVPTS